MNDIVDISKTTNPNGDAPKTAVFRHSNQSGPFCNLPTPKVLNSYLSRREWQVSSLPNISVSGY